MPSPHIVATPLKRRIFDRARSALQPRAAFAEARLAAPYTRRALSIAHVFHSFPQFIVCL
jgi:hypothetical protein